MLAVATWVGRIHAAMVIALVMLSGAAFGTLTRWLVLLVNESANGPFTPGTHAGLPTAVPWSPFGESSDTRAPLPSSIRQRPTRSPATASGAKLAAIVWFTPTLVNV